jgi:hypothetical protein
MEGLPLAASSVLYLSSVVVVLCINGPVLSKILVLICYICSYKRIYVLGRVGHVFCIFIELQHNLESRQGFKSGLIKNRKKLLYLKIF